MTKHEEHLAEEKAVELGLQKCQLQTKSALYAIKALDIAVIEPLKKELETMKKKMVEVERREKELKVLEECETPEARDQIRKASFYIREVGGQPDPDNQKLIERYMTNLSNILGMRIYTNNKED